MGIKKYYLVARNMWDSMTTYRLNFATWRLRMMTRLVTTYFLWDILLRKNTTFLGYTHASIITYILLASFLDAIVFSSRSYEIGDDINNGNLSNYLLRPFNYFIYQAARDAGDKAMNVAFFIGEFAIFYLLVRPPFLIQTNILLILLFLFAIGIATVMCFFFNIILGMIGFWSDESWAARFLFYILIGFFAGNLLPLNMFPAGIYSFLKILPFSYLLFFPLQIYLGKISASELYLGFSIGLGWIFILFFTSKIIWQRGLHTYTAQGR